MRVLIKQKMVIPSDNRKKNLANCRIALQYLKDAGVSLKDDEGMMITGEDVADGDRELTISLLWNIFVHLQVSVSSFSLSIFVDCCKCRRIFIGYVYSLNWAAASSD